MAETQIILADTEANTAIMLMKMGVHSVPPSDANFDGVIDAYVTIRNKINSGEVVQPKKAAAK